MLEQTIYYKLENPYAVSKFIKKTDNKVLVVSIDHRNEEVDVLSSYQFCNLESFLVCPKSEFDTAFAKVMLQCEAMQLFPILGLDMSARVKAHFNQPIQQTTDLKMSLAQQHNQSY